MCAENTPAVKAKWVLETMGIKDVPALHLEDIAHMEKIKVKRCALSSEKDLSGTLIYRGEKKGILINTYINNIGRHNFTFAHELGHYFLKHKPPYISDGESSFRCSNQDMEDVVSHSRIETEANQFAVELLMPEPLFRPLLAGSVFDFTLMNSLANQFYVSKHACGNRILDFIKDPYILICSKGTSITAIKCSSTAKGYGKTIKNIPTESHAYRAIRYQQNQKQFYLSPASIWLGHFNSNIMVYECTRGDYEHDVSMTILKIE
ncbi:MAG: ImmA/IrrE family metallo-endopeptidase [Firmicutes bacterium]|nr:hypothetical protein [Clostridia bacterium]NSW92437.1 ImmA/IrrE family metallo-endopeptidase [Bacillota bacterium]